MRRVAIKSMLVAVPLAFCVSLSGMGQEEIRSAQLDIALSKQNYSVGETVVVTYKITNLSNSLMCFPPPTVDCDSVDGELAANATPPKGIPTPAGGCVADMVVGDADSDIDQRWIKLGPLQSYEITQKSHSIALSDPGRWLVEADYVPIGKDAQSHYGQALKTRDCSLPPELHSKKAKLFVSAKAPKHLTSTSGNQR